MRAHCAILLLGIIAVASARLEEEDERFWGNLRFSPQVVGETPCLATLDATQLAALMPLTEENIIAVRTFFIWV